jgi:hypothetical protein
MPVLLCGRIEGRRRRGGRPGSTMARVSAAQGIGIDGQADSLMVGGNEIGLDEPSR